MSDTFQANDFLYVIFKPTLQCNLRCQYCYAEHSVQTATSMKLDEILHAFAWLADYTRLQGYSQISICWHGGEPFMVPMHIMEEALQKGAAIFQERGLRYRFLTQTNLTLVTDNKHIPLIKKYFDNHLGISFDYKTESRLFPHGNDSTKKALSSLAMLREHDVHCGTLTMLTKKNYAIIPELYSFFKNLKLSFVLNRVFPLHAQWDPKEDIFLTDEEFAQAKIQLFDLWTSDPNPGFFLTDIAETIMDLLTCRPNMCNRKAICQDHYISLSPGGEIFPCGEFDLPEYLLGNFLQETAQEFYAKKAQMIFQSQYPPKAECKDCRYVRVCHGGCLRERVLLGYPYMCDVTKRYYKHIEGWLEKKGLSLFSLELLSADDAKKVFAGKM